MDRHGAESSRNTTRTDLSLLLECLKFQMKCPDLQKQSLQTILSICEKREENVELLREMGGVSFLLNLSKSSFVQSDVQETALYTLGTLAEANVYCKNSLCRKEMFTDLADWLEREDAPLTKKRVIVYFLSVLVANNKLGQTLAQNTSCLDILLNLFRATFPLSAEGIFKSAKTTQILQLWFSVSSALCGCVNNPHNEEAQRACVAIFPNVKDWIQQISLPQTEILQPICSFISMTVANNSCVQESFAASGGLENLTLALIRFCLGSETSLLACQLAVSISKTLSACISDNLAIASGLAQYEVVCHLFTLLINPNLESEDRLSVLLTMGHCTEASEEHQKQLVQIGSLPLIITLLTEDSSEEIRKAATFILHNCKQATNTLGISEVKETNYKDDFTEQSTSFNTYKQSAKELLQRINRLEKKQAEAEQGFVNPQMIPQESTQLPVTGSAPEEESSDGDEEPLMVRVNRNLSSINMKRKHQEETSKPGADEILWPAFNRTRALQSLPCVQRPEGAREPQENSEQFKAPVPQRQDTPQDFSSFEEDVNNETNDPGEEGSSLYVRCTGCSSTDYDFTGEKLFGALGYVSLFNLTDMAETCLQRLPEGTVRTGCMLRLDEVNSRTFSSLQSSCAHSCDMHKVLREATERYMSQHRSLFTHQQLTQTPSAAESHKNQKNWSGVSLTPIQRPSRHECFQEAAQREKYKYVRLTPLHKGMKTAGPAFCQRIAPALDPRERPRPAEKHAEKNKREPSPEDREMEAETSSNSESRRRKRRDFSREEELYLLCGVKTYGPSWNTILWSYPFQSGRTNVDLAQKYRRLLKNKEQDAGLA